MIFRERLWAGPVGVASAVAFGAAVVLVVTPLGLVAAGVAAVVAVIAVTGGLLALAQVVEVTPTTFRAGAAVIDRTYLAAARQLTAEERHQVLGPGWRPENYVLLRSWIRPLVQVDLADPADPTPSWLVSTRRPAQLLAALALPTQAAHSVHTI